MKEIRGGDLGLERRQQAQASPAADRHRAHRRREQVLASVLRWFIQPQAGSPHPVRLSMGTWLCPSFPLARGLVVTPHVAASLRTSPTIGPGAASVSSCLRRTVSALYRTSARRCRASNKAVMRQATAPRRRRLLDSRADRLRRCERRSGLALLAWRSGQGVRALRLKEHGQVLPQWLELCVIRPRRTQTAPLQDTPPALSSKSRSTPAIASAARSRPGAASLVGK